MQPLAASFNETLRVSSFRFQRSLRDLVSSQPLAASSIVFVRFGSWMKKFRKLEFEIRKLEFEFRELGFVFRVMDI